MSGAGSFTELAKRHGTPLFVVDHEEIRRRHRQFTRVLPRVQPYFALKANPDRVVARTLAEAGSGFDVASRRELKIVRKAVAAGGLSGDATWMAENVVFANPVRSAADLKATRAWGSPLTCDNATETRRIARYAPNSRILIRIRVSNEHALVELSSKFGCPFDEVNELTAEAQSLGLNVEGISFHVGSQCLNPDAFVEALRISRTVFDKADVEGFTFSTLDIGGGFPAPYDETVPVLEEFAPVISEWIDTLFPAGVRIIAEPGRHFVATACTAVVEVIGRSVRDGVQCYHVNDGVYGTFSGIQFEGASIALESPRGGRAVPSTVFGPTCDAADTIARKVMLPRLDVGDLLFARNMGAYSIASATSFNGMRPPKRIHVNR